MDGRRALTTMPAAGDSAIGDEDSPADPDRRTTRRTRARTSLCADPELRAARPVRRAVSVPSRVRLAPPVAVAGPAGRLPPSRGQARCPRRTHRRTCPGTPPAPAAPAPASGAARPPGLGSAAQPVTADSLTTDLLLPGTTQSSGRRLAPRSLQGDRRPGAGPESAAERRRRELIARVRTPVTGGHHRVAVMSLKGGVGKTTTTVGLGAMLASLRGDRVIAVDANPDRGTLSDKVRLETAATVRDLLNEQYRSGGTRTSGPTPRRQRVGWRCSPPIAIPPCRWRSASRTTATLPRCWSTTTRSASPIAGPGCCTRP